MYQATSINKDASLHEKIYSSQLKTPNVSSRRTYISAAFNSLHRYSYIVIVSNY